MVEFGEQSMGTLEDIEMPETLYKYRDWADKNHRRMLSHREVFFASPISFEDKFDCKIPTRWDLLTYEEILDKYFQDSFKVQPNLNIKERMLYAIDWANHTMVNNKEYIEKQQAKTFQEFGDFAGVLSLTAYPKENKMWNKYGANHSGFCVGFEPQIMLKNLGTGGGIVHYNDELPIIHPSPKHSHMQQNILQVFFKLTEWAFEKEYRVYIFRNYKLTIKDRTILIPAKAYKELVFGASMNEKERNSIIKTIPKELNHMILKTAYIEDGIIKIKTL